MGGFTPLAWVHTFYVPALTIESLNGMWPGSASFGHGGSTLHGRRIRAYPFRMSPWIYFVGTLNRHTLTFSSRIFPSFRHPSWGSITVFVIN